MTEAKNRAIIVLLISVIASIAVAYVATSKQRIYFSKNPFFKDPSEYLQNDVLSFESLKTHTKSEVIREVWQKNFRNPIRSIIPLIFYPESLKTPYAHLITSVPYLIIFLFLSSWLIYSRYGNLITALLFIALFSSLPFLYNSIYGFAAYYLDLHASLLFASCMILLVFYYNEQQLIYILAFGVLSSLEVLGRYNNAVYLFAAGVPILVFIFIKFKTNRKSILIHYFILTALIGLLTGSFLFGHLRDNFNYAELGYGINFSISNSIKFCFHSIISLLGLKVLGLLFIFFVAFYALFYQSILTNKEQFFLMFWIAISNFIVLQIALRNGAHIASMYYIIVPAIVFLFAPAPIGNFTGVKASIINSTLGLLLVVFAYMDYTDFQSLEKKGKSYEKKFGEAVLGHLKESNDARLSGAIGGFSTANLSLESYYAGGNLLHSELICGKYDVSWPYYYGSKNEDVIEGLFLKSLVRLSGFVLTFADENAADRYFDKASKTASCKFSRKMAVKCIAYINSNKDWERIETFNHPFYGQIILYHKEPH